jgi:hypothetical protein
MLRLRRITVAAVGCLFVSAASASDALVPLSLRDVQDFVVQTRHLPEWDLPIVVGRRPGIEGHISISAGATSAPRLMMSCSPNNHSL